MQRNRFLFQENTKCYSELKSYSELQTLVQYIIVYLVQPIIVKSGIEKSDKKIRFIKQINQIFWQRVNTSVCPLALYDHYSISESLITECYDESRMVLHVQNKDKYNCLVYDLKGLEV